MIITLSASISYAEILAMVNYESKPDQIDRREGIAIIDVDPASKNKGKILMDIPLPYNLVNHHIYYNQDMSKVYVTALGLSRFSKYRYLKKPGDKSQLHHSVT
jgi:hypothetical protein